MARTKNPLTVSTDLEPLTPAYAVAKAADQDNLAVATAAQNERVAALAVQLNYNGSTDPAALENSAKDAIRRIGMGIFELGAYLLLLKEACEHGNFLPTLERLGLGVDAAQRYMAVTRRFANTALTRHFHDSESVGLTKLVELLPLDNEQLEDLTELGQTGELKLDDVARMSVKELRAKVRELRADKDADAQVLAKKNERIDRLEREKRLIQREGPDETLARLQKEVGVIVGELRGLLCGALRQALIAIREHGGQDNTPLMAGLVGQVQSDLSALRDEFTLPDVGATPEWRRWAEAQGEAV